MRHQLGWLAGAGYSGSRSRSAPGPRRMHASPVVNVTARELEGSASGRSISDLLEPLRRAPRQSQPCSPRRDPGPSAAGSLQLYPPARHSRWSRCSESITTPVRKFGSQPLGLGPELCGGGADLRRPPRPHREAGPFSGARPAAAPAYGMGMSAGRAASWSGPGWRTVKTPAPASIPTSAPRADWDDVSHFTQMVWPRPSPWAAGRLTEAAIAGWCVVMRPEEP